MFVCDRCTVYKCPILKKYVRFFKDFIGLAEVKTVAYIALEYANNKDAMTVYLENYG